MQCSVFGASPSQSKSITALNQQRTEVSVPTNIKLTAADYYDLNPQAANRSGDVWSGLPFFGMLNRTTASALVITPACDLANPKSATLTLLPIISVREYLNSSAYAFSLLKAVNGQLTTAQVASLTAPGRFQYPRADEIERVMSEVEPITRKIEVSAKERNAAQRAASGLHIMRSARSGRATVVDMRLLSHILGEAELDRLLSSIIRNSYSADIHYLPPDAQPDEWGVIREASVALFRFPFCAPIEVMEAASDVDIKDWDAEVVGLSECVSHAEQNRGTRPLKHLTLKTRFLADLITRYVGMHVRLGAPDLSDATVENLIQAMKGASQ
jgi:hypothetical protein